MVLQGHQGVQNLNTHAWNLSCLLADEGVRFTPLSRYAPKTKDRGANNTRYVTERHDVSKKR